MDSLSEVVALCLVQAPLAVDDQQGTTVLRVAAESRVTVFLLLSSRVSAINLARDKSRCVHLPADAAPWPDR